MRLICTAVSYPCLYSAMWQFFYLKKSHQWNGLVIFEALALAVATPWFGATWLSEIFFSDYPNYFCKVYRCRSLSGGGCDWVSPTIYAFCSYDAHHNLIVWRPITVCVRSQTNAWDSRDNQDRRIYLTLRGIEIAVTRPNLALLSTAC